MRSWLFLGHITFPIGILSHTTRITILLDHLKTAQDNDLGMDQELFMLRAIIGHQGPLKATDLDWKGSKYIVQVEWETGEITFEPLSGIAVDGPVTCTGYAKQNDLLALAGW